MQARRKESLLTRVVSTALWQTHHTNGTLREDGRRLLAAAIRQEQPDLMGVAACARQAA